VDRKAPAGFLFGENMSEYCIVEDSKGNCWQAEITAGAIQKNVTIGDRVPIEKGEIKMTTTTFNATDFLADYQRQLAQQTEAIIKQIKAETEAASSDKEKTDLSKLSLAELNAAARNGDITLDEFNREMEARQHLGVAKAANEAALQDYADFLEAIWAGKAVELGTLAATKTKRIEEDTSRFVAKSLETIAHEAARIGLRPEDAMERDIYISNQYEILEQALGPAGATAALLKAAEVKQVNDPADALHELRKMADGGDALAQYYLAAQAEKSERPDVLEIRKSRETEEDIEARREAQLAWLEADRLKAFQTR
jgi:hypothetical protein